MIQDKRVACLEAPFISLHFACALAWLRLSSARAYYSYNQYVYSESLGRNGER